MAPAARRPGRRFWRKTLKLLREPVRFFDDARDPAIRRAGLRWLLACRSLPLTPGLVGYAAVRAAWRATGGRGLRLRPLQGLQAEREGWLALDADPQFALESWLPIPRGPLQVTLALAGFAGEEPTKLYLGDRGRYAEADALALPLDREGRGQGLAVLPRGQRPTLRFDPMGAPGPLAVAALRLRPLGHRATLAGLQRAGWPLETALAYLLTGRVQRRRAGARPGMPAGRLAAVQEPSAEAWARLVPPPAALLERARVDVVVPVYDDRAATLACLYSVLANPQATPFRLVVVDDCGPDAGLRTSLAELAGRGLFHLERNDANLGFVRSANRGMALAPARDVVLLNADTEVYNDWLDRLLALAATHSRAATITPLTNNGEIASYPYGGEAFPWELELDFAALDRLAAAANRGAAVAAPTGVGFCLYLRRAALEELGGFDEAAFGQGYGEENDLCQRAIAAGWSNLIAPGIFVRHLGQRSFGESRARRVREALAVVERRHPHYRASVEYFLEEDPMAASRAALDQARVAALPRRTARLAVLHHSGGGTEAHVADRAARLERQGILLLVARPAMPPQSRQIALEIPGRPFLPNLPRFDLLGDPAALLAFLAEQRVEAIELHNLVGYTEEVAEALPELAQRLGVPLELYLHDYQAFCPRINLVTPELEFCDLAPPERCERCLARGPGQIPVAQVAHWRQRYAGLLRAAGRVVAPSEDTAARFRRALPDLAIEVRPHPDLLVWDEEQDCELTLPPPRAGRRRVCLIGAISEVKGQRQLVEVARLALARGSPLEFVVLGEVGDPPLLRDLANVTVTGRYAEAAALPTLRRLGADIAWFPAIWPETFCYTLSLAHRVGLPCLVPDLGALTRAPAGRATGGTTLCYAPGTPPAEILALLEPALAVAR